MNTPEKCQKCQSPVVRPYVWQYGCGTTLDGTVSELCETRTQLAATRKELEEYRKERQEFIDRDNAMKMAAQDDAARIAKSESRVHELEKEVTEALELALDQCGAERLSGNIVKEEYWKGELAAIRRMKQAIGEMPGGGK